MAGFAAACYLRGIPFVQIPTSLLAQVDSSVGGKTAVDLLREKTWSEPFISRPGAYRSGHSLHPASKWFADGMGEVIKYGCIRSEELFSLLEAENFPKIWRKSFIAVWISSVR